MSEKPKIENEISKQDEPKQSKLLHWGRVSYSVAHRYIKAFEESPFVRLAAVVGVFFVFWTWYDEVDERSLNREVAIKTLGEIERNRKLTEATYGEFELNRK